MMLRYSSTEVNQIIPVLSGNMFVCFLFLRFFFFLFFFAVFVVVFCCFFFFYLVFRTFQRGRKIRVFFPDKGI